jgi:hypothetical protein
VLAVNGTLVKDDVAALALARDAPIDVVFTARRLKGKQAPSQMTLASAGLKLQDFGSGVGLMMEEDARSAASTTQGLLDSMNSITVPSASLQEQVKLMKEGHLANARGEVAEARSYFRQCYDVGGRVEARISAANMSLKMGEFTTALAEYETMAEFMRQNPHTLSPRVGKVLQRKLLDASHSVQMEAAAKGFLSGGKTTLASEQFGGSGKLHVYVRRATGLRVADYLVNSSDPYAKVKRQS